MASWDVVIDGEKYEKFQSRCRDWVVGECPFRGHSLPVFVVSVSLPRLGGWRVKTMVFHKMLQNVSVSLPRLGGWREVIADRFKVDAASFSLVAEIGWLASSHRG